MLIHPLKDTRIVLVGAFALAAFNCVPATARAECDPVPARLSEGRFFIPFVTTTGLPFLALSDTGGGGVLITRRTADQLGLDLTAAAPEMAAELGDDAGFAPSPDVAAPFPALPSPALIASQAGPVPGWPEPLDAMIGQNWFAGRRWTWDYPAGSLSLDCPVRGRPIDVGLPDPDAAPSVKRFPRMWIEVAEEPLAVLFDTGASTWLTAAALDVLKDGRPAARAASMATASRIRAWREAHPNWRVIEGAQHGTGARMIEVLDVSIAGFQVGPVWFTERPDRVFETMMSPMMTGPIEGALGGEALRDLRITLDYRERKAWVERP